MKTDLKYKPHCTMRCLKGNCKTREAGGCYCVCRLVDTIEDIKDIIKGKLKYSGILDKKKAKEYLNAFEKRLKEFEI